MWSWVKWRWCPSTRRCCTSRPVYVESSGNQIPTLKDVVVVYNSKAYHSSNASLDNALCQMHNPDGSAVLAYCNTAAAQGPLVSSTPASVTVPAPGRRPRADHAHDRPDDHAYEPPSTPVTAPAGATVTSLVTKAQAAYTSAKQP